MRPSHARPALRLGFFDFVQVRDQILDHQLPIVQMLDKRVVELGIVESVSDTPIHRVLKKPRSNRTAAATG